MKAEDLLGPEPTVTITLTAREALFLSSSGSIAVNEEAADRGLPAASTPMLRMQRSLVFNTLGVVAVPFLDKLQKMDEEAQAAYLQWLRGK